VLKSRAYWQFWILPRISVPSLMNFHVMYNDVCICTLFPRKKGAHTHAEGKVVLQISNFFTKIQNEFKIKILYSFQLLLSLVFFKWQYILLCTARKTYIFVCFCAQILIGFLYVIKLCVSCDKIGSTWHDKTDCWDMESRMTKWRIHTHTPLCQ